MINHFLGMPESASQHAFQIDQMIEFCHWFMLILFTGWLSFYFYLLWRFSAKKNPKADYFGAEGTIFKHLEFVVVLVEAVLLLGFAIPLWWQRTEGFPEAKSALTIDVIAQAFAWNYHYPGADGIQGKRNMNLVSNNNQIGLDPTDKHSADDIIQTGELVVPVNKPIILRISSKDVIHDFAVPEMRIAKDAIPGTRIPIWFTPTRLGTFTVICGQLCGAGHYSMKGYITVKTADEYKQWLGEQKTAGDFPIQNILASH